MREFLRIERKELLGAFDQIQKGHRCAAKEQHCHGVFGPTHFVLLVNACQAIDKSFDWSQNQIKKSFLATENARQEHAQRFSDQKNYEQEKTNLKPTVGAHGVRIPQPSATRRAGSRTAARKYP